MTVTTTSASATFTRSRLTWFSYSCIGLYAYLLNLLGLIIPFLRGEMGFSYTVSSLHSSAFAVGMIIVGATGDQIANKLGRRTTLWVGMLGVLIGSLLLLFAWHPWMTIGATFLMGTIGSLIMVISNASLSDQYHEQRTVAFAESNVIAGIYTLAAPILLGIASRSLPGWRAAPAVMVGYILLIYWLFQAVQPAASRQAKTTGWNKSTTRLPARYWRYWTVIGVGVAAEFCIISWAATFLEVNRGVTRENAALILSIFFLAMLLGRWLGTMVVRWIDASRLLLIAIGLSALGFLIHWLAPNPTLSVAGLFVAGLGIANNFPLSLGLAIGAAPNQSDAASARIIIASGSAILTLPLLLGGLADRIGLWYAYPIVLPLLAVAALLVLTKPTDNS